MTGGAGRGKEVGGKRKRRDAGTWELCFPRGSSCGDVYIYLRKVVVVLR